jgi:TolB-like protein
LAPTAPLPHSGRPPVAVLPFRSSLQEDDLFADGMAEDLTAALSASPWMEVVAASATAAYRTGARDLRQIGRELGARYLLEGNVRRAGDDLRVAAQLVEAEEGKVLWTQKFHRPLGEVAALQEGLVTEIAAHLSVQVERAEMEHALRKPGSFTAWEAFVRAVAFFSRATRSGYDAAVAEARRALEIDPNYVPGSAVLLTAQGMLLPYRVDDEPELAREIVENVRRARSLDPDDLNVLGGCVAAFCGLRKPQDALPFAERAKAINPNVDFVRQSMGIVLLPLGRSDEGLAELDAAERLGPKSIRDHLEPAWRSVAHLQAGRLDQALHAADQAVRLLVSPEALIQSALCLALMNNCDGARAALRRMRDTDPELSRAQIENLVRFFHCGSSAVGEYVAIAGKLWDEVEGGSS